MKVAVLRFPGSNNDQDALFSLRGDIGVEAEYVWHEDTSLEGYDAVFLPGGFSYGDYLRCGSMASLSPIMGEVKRVAEQGKPVIGVCNGFQVLCEAGLLPGALLLNEGEKFVCKPVRLKPINRASIWTQGVDRVVTIPIAHGEGRYVCDDSTLAELKEKDQIAFVYVDESDNKSADSNPNGSVANIAGVLNQAGNVLGMMPHPERWTNDLLGGTDGLLILNGLNLVTTR